MRSSLASPAGSYPALSAALRGGFSAAFVFLAIITGWLMFSLLVPAAQLQGVDPSQNLIGSPVTLVVFTRNKFPIGSAMIQIPFTQDSAGTATFTVYVDVNGDGAFSESERGVSEVPSVARTELPASFPLLFGNQGQMQKLLASSKKKSLTAKILLQDVPGPGTVTQVMPLTRVEYETRDLFTNPPPGFTGGGRGETGWRAVFTPEIIPSAIAKGGGTIDIYNKDVPDLPPRKGKANECFPTAATNSLLWLSKKDHFEDKMPQPATQDAVSDELDRDLGWNAKSGVEDAKMVDGKNAFASRHKIPLHTKKIDNEIIEGRSDLWDKLVKELQDGEDVELIIQKKESQRGTSTLGHAVTVVGANDKNGKQQIIIHDLLTPQGNDTYEVRRDGQVQGYGAIAGKFFVGYIISESIEPGYIPPVSSSSSSSKSLPPSSRSSQRSSQSSRSSSKSSVSSQHSSQASLSSAILRSFSSSSSSSRMSQASSKTLVPISSLSSQSSERTIQTPFFHSSSSLSSVGSPYSSQSSVLRTK